MNSSFALVLVSAALAPRAAAQQPASQPFSIGETITIHSQILREDRRIYVYDPDVASDNRLPSYPVL